MIAGRERLIAAWQESLATAEHHNVRLGAPGGAGFANTRFTTIGGDLNYVRATGAARLAAFRNPPSELS